MNIYTDNHWCVCIWCYYKQECQSQNRAYINTFFEILYEINVRHCVHSIDCCTQNFFPMMNIHYRKNILCTAHHWWKQDVCNVCQGQNIWSCNFVVSIIPKMTNNFPLNWYESYISKITSYYCYFLNNNLNPMRFDYPFLNISIIWHSV